jgi:hypothetical protein
MFLAFLSTPGHVNLHELAVILPSRFDDAFPLDTPRAESSHEGVVLAAQHDDVRVRLVKVVLEQGEEEVFCAHFALPPRAVNRLTFTSMPTRASSGLSASPSFRQGALGAKERKARGLACPHKQCHRQHEGLHRCNAPVSTDKYNGHGTDSSVWREEGSLGEGSRGAHA